MPPRKPANKKENRSAPLGFEAKLWAAADALRNNMDAAEYKHVVLGLIEPQTVLEQAEVLSAGWAAA